MTGSGSDGVRILDPDACWSLLETQSLGRLAVAAERLEVFPVNFLVHDRAVYFATAPGTKLVELAASPDVAFETDGEADGELWSVVVHGHATRLAADRDIEASGVLRLRGWHPTGKHNYVRIDPESITGRRFRPVR